MSVRDIERHLADLYGTRIGSDTCRVGLKLTRTLLAAPGAAGPGRVARVLVGWAPSAERPPGQPRSGPPALRCAPAQGPANASASALPATAPPVDRPARHSGAPPRSRQESPVSSVRRSFPARGRPETVSRLHAPNRGRSGLSAGALTLAITPRGSGDFPASIGRISTTDVWSVPLGSGTRTAQHEQRGKYPINQT
jgi:hypothetical protein